MDEPINMREYADKVIDLTNIGYELGFYFNNCGNFSMLPMPNGDWFCCFRIFGYWIDSIGRYLTSEQLRLHHPDLHQFCVLDRDFNFVRKVDCVESTYYKHPDYANELPYLEDGRLVAWNGNWYISTCVVYQENLQWKHFGLELQRLTWEDGNIHARHCWNSIECGIQGRHKNWLPVPDRPFNFIVGTSRHGAQVIDISKNTLTNIGATSKGEFYRGNTPLVKTDEGYVAIGHVVLPPSPERPIKTYYNHLVTYSNDLCPVSISKPFKLTDSPIEFVTTMNEMPDNRIAIGVTAMDETPYVLVFDKKRLATGVNGVRG